jgi:hypothetical protein
MKIKVTFTEPLLGTLSGNKELAKDFIAAKNPAGPAQDELAAIDTAEVLENSSTIFPRLPDGRPFLWDYQWKGFFKEACGAMLDAMDMTQEELKKVNLTKYSHKRTIDRLLFVFPRQIPLAFTGETTYNERPLRAETMRGERIALARSEQVPAGATCEIEIKLLNPKLDPFVLKWLDYGSLKGMGQWRNASYGRYSFAAVE